MVDRDSHTNWLDPLPLRDRIDCSSFANDLGLLRTDQQSFHLLLGDHEKNFLDLHLNQTHFLVVLRSLLLISRLVLRQVQQKALHLLVLKL